MATLGTQTINLILTIGFVFIPYFTRLVRGNVLTLKEREFVDGEPRQWRRLTDTW